MKLSCLPVSFFDEIISGQMTIAQWAKTGASLGLDGIDISILFVKDHSQKNLDEMNKTLSDVGMRIVMVTSYPDFTHPDPSQRKQELELAKEVVSVAKRLGASYLRVTAGQAHPEIDREHGIQWAVEGLIGLVEATKNSGVELVYENHAKPGAWKYTDFSQPPEIFLEIVKQTEHIGLGINFDTGNAATFAQDPVALLNTVLPRVKTIHASDSAEKDVLKHVLLGTGITPFPDLFTQLKQSGWDGWICLEEASFQGEEGVRKAVNYIKTAWLEA